MTAATPPLALRSLTLPALWVRAGAATALVDGTFASVQSVFFYDSTFARLWQGVASTVLGPTAIGGGKLPILAGLVMHVCVAFAWSGVFLLLATRIAGMRRLLAARGGIPLVAAVYGPCIWMAMSLIVIPTLVHRPTAITPRWWFQFAGHMVFVGLPIVWTVGAGLRRSSYH